MPFAARFSPRSRTAATPAPARLARPAAVGRPLRRFGRDEAGVISIETMIFLPVLIFTLSMMVLLADMFRSQTVSLRAAYTVADTLSRRVDPVDVAYLDGTGTLYGYLARGSHGHWLRVSSIGVNSGTGQYEVIWSHHTSEGDALTTEQLLLGLHEQLPSMPAGETVLLVEAGTSWRPFLPGWLPQREFNQLAVTRPRFTPQLRFDDGTTIIFQPVGPPTCDDGNDLCDPAT